MTAGAQYGYLLVWVVLAGNIMAWLIQYLSAKLGVVTGQSLPEVLGARLKRPWARRAYWLQAELVAMATDLAEVIGGAVALNLLFDVPLLLGGLITGAVSMILLTVQSRRGARPFEFVIIGLMVIITVGFVAGVFVAPPDPAGCSEEWSRVSKTPARYCWPHPSSARRSCRTRSTRTPPSPVTASRHDAHVPATRRCAPRPHASAACSPPPAGTYRSRW